MPRDLSKKVFIISISRLEVVRRQIIKLSNYELILLSIWIISLATVILNLGQLTQIAYGQ